MAEPKKSADILVGALAGQVLGPGLVVLPGQGNSLSIETDAGVVVIDASGPRHADGMIDTLREHTDAPVHATSADELPLHGWEPLAAGKEPVTLDPGELTLVATVKIL